MNRQQRDKSMTRNGFGLLLQSIFFLRNFQLLRELNLTLYHSTEQYNRENKSVLRIWNKFKIKFLLPQNSIRTSK